MTTSKSNQSPPAEDDDDLSAELAEHQITAAVDMVVPGLGLALEILDTMFKMSEAQVQLQPGVPRRRAKLKTQAALRL